MAYIGSGRVWAYYSENNSFAADWLRNLIAEGRIAPGMVDDRSIVDVQPADLAGFRQVHLFAGIGVWSLALRSAGWGDERAAWTGSCPCQPWSAAGAGGGFDDPRHLWPHMHRLVSGEHRPTVIFGEQVASKDSGPWIDLVQDDLEALDYAFGAIPFPAAGIGAPHIRDRLYWVADTLLDGLQRIESSIPAIRGRRLTDPSGAGVVRLADADNGGRLGGWGCLESNGRAAPREQSERLRDAHRVGHAGGEGSPICECSAVGGAGRRGEGGAVEQPGCSSCGLAHPSGGGRREQWDALGTRESRHPDGSVDPLGGLAYSHGRDTSAEWEQCGGEHGQQPENGRVAGGGGDPGPTNGFWRDADWLLCRDGRWRPVEPGTSPLAHGAPSRVGRLHGFGNAINRFAAQAFIQAYVDARAGVVEP